MYKEIEHLLLEVQKPARYTGGEFGAVMKDKGSVDTRIVFCFPDTYEIGMSHLGLRILYGLWNELDGVWCERAFAPWPDMEERLRQRRIPLFALESGDSLRDFDIIAFTLQYELSFTNILNMLDLAGIPVRAADRAESDPLVIAGGPCAFNPEPLCDFIDLFILGEGEEVNVELTELYRDMKRAGASKREFLSRAARIGGVYVPSLYSVSYNPDGTVAAVTPEGGAPETVTKRILQDIDGAYFPETPIVPSTEIVHDRVMLEVFRGCIRGCRFCQAGHVYRPVRAKSAKTLIGQGTRALKNSGYQEISLSSLSTSDYRPLNELCDGLLEYCVPNSANVSLPSLRADNFSLELLSKVQRVRKSGLTFAPEAGTQRLRDVINKNVTEKDVLSACSLAFGAGYGGVKLYFMMGLPTETDEDILGIAELAHRVFYTWRQTTNDKSRGVRVTASTSCFVPKPMTPFQWEPQDTMAEFRRKQQLLKDAMRKSITYNWHDPETSFLEAVIARGDRRLGAVIEAAWRSGCRLDGWSEFFSLQHWLQAFSLCGLDPAFYANRTRGEIEVFPWDHLSAGVTREHMLREREAAFRGEISPDCRQQCSSCGASGLLTGGVCDA